MQPWSVVYLRPILLLSLSEGMCMSRMKAASLAFVASLAMVLTIFVSPSQAAVQTLTVGATEDTFISAAAPTANNGTALNARISGDPEKIAFFKFDAKALPGGSGSAAAVTKATLKLTGIANTQTPGAVSVYGSGHTWTETGLTYNNKPSRNGLMDTGTISASTTTSFDVTTALQNDADGLNAFQVFSSLASDNTVATRENGTAAWRPQLVIEYGTTTPVVKPNLVPSIPGAVGDNTMVNIKAGDQVQFNGNWTVADAPTDVAVRLDWYVDDAWVTNIAYGNPGVAAGTYGSASTGKWTATEGTHTIKMVMDVTNTVDESSETENSSTRTITVAPASTPANDPPTVNAGVDKTTKLPADTVNLDATVTDDGTTAPTTTWSKVSGPGTVTFGNAASVDTTAKFSIAGTYVIRLTANDGVNPAVSDDATVTVQAADVTPPSSGLPYTADSFFKSTVAGAPIDAALTSKFQYFMANQEDQAGINFPKVNLNDGWSGHNWVSKSTDPIWKLTGTNGSMSDPALAIVKSQGVHLADSVWDTVPTGTQDRLLVIQDKVFGYTVQCADVVGNKTTRTWSASNCGIMWHSSNGLDRDNPLSNDQRNFTSRGRIPDSMQVPRSEIDAAVDAGTGLGHVMQMFFVATCGKDGHVHPMSGEEGSKICWTGQPIDGPDNDGGIFAEGTRLRIKPSVDLAARGLTGAALVIAKTLQQNGTYIGDNSGAATQLKIGPPSDYVGTNLSTNVFSGKISWTDFEVIQPGWQ